MKELAIVDVERFNGTGAAGIRSTVADVYRTSYVEAIARDDRFTNVDAFADRFDRYVQVPGFELVLARGADGVAVGQAWGWPLGPTSAWWSTLAEVPDPQFTDEDGHRTFAVSEIMVAASIAGRGVAYQLQAALLGGRTERRATLLVEVDNERARNAYLRWGWQPVAQLLPSWDDAPVCDVMVLDLQR